MSLWIKNSIVFSTIVSLLFFSLPLSANAITCPAGQQPNLTNDACIQGVTGATIPTTNTAIPTACRGLTGGPLTQCLNTQSGQSTLNRFNPNVNINTGNSYGGGGINITGVGGAIASCTNVGAFLVNTATKLLSKQKFAKNAMKPINKYLPSDSKIPVEDTVAQDKLASIEKTNKCLDGIAYAVAKNALAQMTNKTLNWVNTGLEGNPLYVQNRNSYLVTIGRSKVRSYLQTARESDPIFGNALESTVRHSVTGQSDGLLSVPRDTPEAREYSTFFGDFSSGGWNSFLNPKNNPVGALFTATDRIAQEIAQSKEDAKDEIQRNNGFLDLKHCVEYEPDDISTTELAIVNGLSSNRKCKQWVTDTPGSIIASQVETITNSPIRQLEYADKINEVLGGFFDSFVNNLLAKGLRGTGGAFGSNINFGFSSQGSNIVLDSNGNALNASGAASLGYQGTQGGNGLGQNFDISRPQQFQAILQTQANYLNRAKDAQAALQRVVPTIGALDYCIPGPNPNWSEGLSSNWSTFTGSLQQESADSPSVIEGILSSIQIIGGLFSNDKPPQIWSTPGIINDPATGMSVQVPRTFFNSSADFEGGFSTLLRGIDTAFNAVADHYEYYNLNTEVKNAFQQAAVNDSDTSYYIGFLREVDTETASLVGYNEAASEIDAQYDENIGQTESNIDQMEILRKQINEIVAQAKADYIKKRAAEGNPVDLACINGAYQIDNRQVVGVARQQSDSSNDPIVLHSAASANYFYGEVIK